MREYDFSKSHKNPYVKLLARQITIRLDAESVTYFQQLAIELGVPYQNLISLYLRDCAVHKRRPEIAGGTIGCGYFGTTLQASGYRRR